MEHLSLTIPKPCSETWRNFTPAVNGGFCTSCSKVVIDFTKMGDDEIRDFFHHKPTETCGRFRPGQLKEYSHKAPPAIRPGLTLLKASFLSLLLMLVAKQGLAQNTTTKAKSEVVQYPDYPKEESFAEKSEHIVKGVVISIEDNLPVPGVNIHLKGSTVGTSTDANGEFEFPQKLKEGDVLFISFIGYDTQEYRVRKDAKPVIEVMMTLDYVTLMGEVAIDGVYTTNTSGLTRWWQKVKGLF